MINGGPDPLFVKAMVVPSREVVVRFSPVDFVRPLEYQITSPPTATIARITTNVIRCIEPPDLSSRSASAQFARSRCAGSKTQTDSLRYRGARLTRSWEGRRRGSPEFEPCRHRRASGALRRDPPW